MRLITIYEYFKGKEGLHLTVGEDKKVRFKKAHYHDASDEMSLYFGYKEYPLSVRVSKPQADLRLQFNKKIPGLQRETYTPIEKLDSTLLIYLGKFAEELEETVEYKLFDWRG